MPPIASNRPFQSPPLKPTANQRTFTTFWSAPSSNQPTANHIMVAAHVATGHCSDIKNNRPEKSVAAHLNIPGHSQSDFTILVRRDEKPKPRPQEEVGKLLDPPPEVTCTRRSQSGSLASCTYAHRNSMLTGFYIDRAFLFTPAV